MASDISPENQQYLDQAVANGTYPSEAQALDEAVELLRKRDQLRAEVNVGMAEAERGELLPEEEVFDRLEKRARQIEANARKSA